MAALCQGRGIAGAVRQTAAVQRSAVQRAPLHVCASYKNKENIDLSGVAAFAKHGSDVGGCEVQVARLTARVQQISSHLRGNRKDFASQRGLQAVLNQRKKLLQYLYRHDRSAYDRCIVELGIRSVVAGDTHKAAQRAAAANAAS